ncbi:hypothetical protein BGW39_007194 [Mortierella sp. 14UC]|nr:hypothetical protein BGW39_007194 [Mortierella sp. 14UC]
MCQLVGIATVDHDPFKTSVQEPSTAAIATAAPSQFPTSLLAVLLLLLPAPASAQQLVPIPTQGCEFTFVTDRTLYVRGGRTQGDYVQQFFSLDLTPLLFHSYKLTWKQLFAGGPLQVFKAEFPMAIILNNTNLVYFSDTRMMANYDIATDRWLQKATPTCQGTLNPKDSVHSAMRALADPTTNIVYIPFGYANRTEMLVYHEYYDQCSSVPMPASSRGYGYAWSEIMYSLYMFGDTVPPTGPTMWEFQATTNIWVQIPMKGSPPAVLYDGCLTPVLQGRKLLLFGGENLETGTAYGDMFIFDTTTYIWTKATSAPKPRTDLACASAGDYFVGWGGVEDANSDQPSAELLLYNFKTDNWVKQEEITSHLNTNTSISTSSAGSGFNNSGISRAEAAAIGGGTAAAVVVIAVIVGLIIYRRHQRKYTGPKRHPQDLKPDSSAYPGKSDSTLLFRNGLDPNVTLDPRASFNPAAGPQHWDANLKTEITDGAEREVFAPTFDLPNPQYQPLPMSEGADPSSQPAMSSPFLSPQRYSNTAQLDPSWQQQQQQRQQSQSLTASLNTAARSPQGEHNESPVGPLEQIKLIQATYEQNMEQMRRDQQAALERVRRQWEEDQAQRLRIN